MVRHCITLSLLFASAAYHATNLKAEPPITLTATEIANKNIAARGGVEKWRAVQSLTMTGTMEAGGNTRTSLPTPLQKDRASMPGPRPPEQVRLPFTMELKRPSKMRVEVVFQGQKAIQVYDGSHGWKLRPFLNRREVEPYTETEMQSVASQAELDGPLVDYTAKGTAIALAGTEKVDGKDTYRLRLTLKSGKTQDVWIDAATFLETKIEGTPRRLDGRERHVEVYYRDFRPVEGLQVPFVLETQVLNAQAGPGGSPYTTAREQIHLDKVQINGKLDDALFSKASLDAEAGGSPGTNAATVARR